MLTYVYFLWMIAMNVYLFLCLILWPSSEFFNWNKLKVKYCDGSSFSSNPDTEFKVSHTVYIYYETIYLHLWAAYNIVNRTEHYYISVHLCTRMGQNFFSGVSLSGTHLWMSYCQSECLKLDRYFLSACSKTDVHDLVPLGYICC